MKNRLSCCAVVFSLSLLTSGVPQAEADARLPKVFGSHMVLQCQRPLPIWGWADPGEEVTVRLDKATATATADAKGDWKVELPAMEADGKAHSMTVSGKNRIELDDILIGEVWIGSGQSNMEFSLWGSTGGKQAVAAANCPQIRLLHVEKVQTPQPAKDIVVFNGPKVKNQPAPPPATGPAWKVCTPQSVPFFSAVLYYFGQRLHKELHVPVGLINSSWGGSPIEAWLSGTQAGGMYNGMIAPVQPFAIRGVIWYQGETNVLQKSGMKYSQSMQHLIGGWRQAWSYDFPFYFVQIAPFTGTPRWHYPDGELTALWEAQAASLKIPATGMVVVTDKVRDLKNIHPIDKLEVGNRLALWALAKDYGRRDLVYSGPLYKSMKVEGNKIRLVFAHVGGGLKSRNGKPLTEFAIAGADSKFVPAEAAIVGNTILVEAKEVASPTQVRFGWRNEANPNLVNEEGLPASPFQTNNWQGGTGE
jgi:sialate O-acetylesterase